MLKESRKKNDKFMLMIGRKESAQNINYKIVSVENMQHQRREEFQKSVN